MITERNKTISFWAASFVIPHNPSITANNKREDGKVSSKNQYVLQDQVTRTEINSPISSIFLQLLTTNKDYKIHH
jgi:hypothetical protein